MFIVLKVEAIEQHIHGYISRFLYEPTTGVYCGKTSKVVADHLWNKVVSNVRTGKVCMITSTSNEMGFTLQMHNNTNVQIRDHDGLDLPVLVMIPDPE